MTTDPDRVAARLLGLTDAVYALDEHLTAFAGVVESRFARHDAHLASHDAHLASMDARLAGIDARLASHDVHLASIDQKLDAVIARLDRLSDAILRGFTTLTARVAALEATVQLR